MLYRTIKTDTWRDPWFHSLAPHSKCLFLYLFTNPVMSACGSMEISLDQIAFDVGLSKNKISSELSAFGDKVLWIPEHNLLLVRNFYRHQRGQSSGNFTIAAIKAMGSLPDEARVWLASAHDDLKEGLPIPSPRDSFGETIPSPTQGDKEESKSKSKSRESREEGRGDAARDPVSLPEHGEAQKIVKVYCQEAGIERPADYGKAVGFAGRMVKAGICAADIPALFAFVASWSDGPDLSILFSSIDKWRTSRNLPPKANGRASPKQDRGLSVSDLMNYPGRTDHDQGSNRESVIDVKGRLVG